MCATPIVWNDNVNAHTLTCPEEMGVLSVLIALLCVGGVALSYYAVHIEEMKSNNDDYRATCDLDEKIACSKVVTSK